MKEKTIILFLTGVARLPLRVLYMISDVGYLVLYHLVKYRRGVVRKNLRDSFPEKSDTEIKRIEKDYYHYLADQMVETLKTLHISDKELKRRVKINNFEIVNASLEKGKNAVLMMGHYGNWEWVQEISRYFTPGAYMASIYHPLNNPTWDKVFIHLRSRWGAHIVPMHKAPRILLDRKNSPWVCGFIADQWTWKKDTDNLTEFLNHPTWFIPGPEEIGRKTGADFFYLEMSRTARGKYEITFHPLDPQDDTSKYSHSKQFWHEFEKSIRKAPTFWLWSHKRWK